MSVQNPAVSRIKQILDMGGVILSDNDGTLAPFTETPDETIIPPATLDAIARVQQKYGQASFTIGTGRDYDAMQAVIDRSAKNPPAIPLLTDDGALYRSGSEDIAFLSDQERDFFAESLVLVNAFLDSQSVEDQGQIAVERRVASVNINLNQMHRVQGEEKAVSFKGELSTLFTGICKNAPEVDGKKSFSVHSPPGHGIEIRSALTTKKQGVEALIDKGILPKDKPFIFLCDDIKIGGNDVALAEFARESGGFVIQIKHPGNFRSYSDDKRAITPDLVLEGSESIAGLLNNVTGSGPASELKSRR